jgi:hypothetical protein
MAPKVTRENSLIGERFAKAGAIQRQAPLCQGETGLAASSAHSLPYNARDLRS